jgi:hypothetical protein
MTESERRQLLEFTHQLEDDISYALEYTRFEGDLRELAFAAWQAVREREFQLVRDGIESGEFDDRMDANGLSGVELQFKLRLVDAARDAVAQEPDEPDESRWSRLRKRLRQLLASAEVIFDSLVDALTGRGEAIKEIKEGIGIGLED